MKSSHIILGSLVALVVIGGLIAFASYNGLVRKSQATDAAWAEVETNYQRRADLVPNLVATVRGAANFEQATLTEVTEARARATSINLSAEDLTPEKLAEYQNAQNQLSGALGRLLAVSEAYPALTATESFKGLQTQLEGTENRIAVSRRDFNVAVQSYNVAVRTVPGSLFASMFGFAPKAYFEAAAGSDQVPAVVFP